MELVTLIIEGFRRFREPTTLALNGKLIALLGPNEAGKSSVIKAIHHLNHAEPIDPIDISRIDPVKTQIEGRFYLDSDDLEAANINVATWLTITKAQTGARTFELDPRTSKRDIRKRHKIASDLKKVTENQYVIQDLENSEAEALAELGQLAMHLMGETEDLPPPVIAAIKNSSTILEDNLGSKAPKYAKKLSARLDSLAEAEQRPNPNAFALSAVTKRLPPILEFADADRSLAGEYNLAEVVPNTPSSLSNIIHVADLDLQAVYAAVQKDHKGKIQTLLHAANNTLKEVFSKTWSQSGIEVYFRVDGAVLNILIVDGGVMFSAVTERSDGLQQFVALQAFTTRNRVVQPILLIDEAEMHLHYDAQADLIQMLTRQQVAPKVIFSTHSAGCLPEDLGVGVRLVIPDEKKELESTVRNKFWTDDHRGFSPLLFGMGASTLAFFPTRRAVVVEGASDMLLLPTLMREAISAEYLGFQIVPGLANANQSELPKLHNVGTHVAYFVDTDPGGAALRDKLIESGVTRDRIFKVNPTTGSVCTLEDFIELDLYTSAVNELLSRYHANAKVIKSGELSGPNRVAKLKASVEARGLAPLSKVDIANIILDKIFTMPELKILDKKYAKKLSNIYNKIIKILDVDRSG